VGRFDCAVVLTNKTLQAPSLLAIHHTIETWMPVPGTYVSLESTWAGAPANQFATDFLLAQ